MDGAWRVYGRTAPWSTWAAHRGSVAELVVEASVSEYQYYEFQAIDRRLTEAEMVTAAMKNCTWAATKALVGGHEICMLAATRSAR